MQTSSVGIGFQSASDLPDHFYVDSTEKLASVTESIPYQSVLAVDCEFIRRTSYFPIPALLQLGWYGTDHQYHCALVDLPALNRYTQLRNILERAKVLVMHAASEDIQVLGSMGFTTLDIFDTQLARALTAGEDSLSYQALVKKELDITIASGKRVQRSNWLARPLSTAQKRYALQDVAYLLPMHNRLQTKLAKLKRSDWLAQECAFMVQKFLGQPDAKSDHFWKAVKGGDKLRDPLARSRMRLLADWRNQQGHELNIACGLLLDDEHLLFVSTHPQSLAESLVKTKLGKRIPKQAIVRITDMLYKACVVDAPPLKRLSRKQQQQVLILQSKVAELATKHGIPPRLLAAKQRIIDWVQSDIPKPSFGNWQDQLLAPVLVSCMQLQNIADK